MDREERAAWVPVLVSARKAWNMTQDDLAKKAGVSLKSVGNLEAGSITPQAATIEKVREALELSPNLWLAQGEVDHRVTSRWEAATLEAYERMQGRTPEAQLRRFSTSQLLREVLKRTEDPEYASELDSERFHEHDTERDAILNEMPTSLRPDFVFNSDVNAVSEQDDELRAVADNGEIEGSGENSI